MKKRILTLALALTLMVFAAIPAMATNITETSDPKTGSAILTYNVAVKYTVTIPEAITINTEKTGTMTVSVSENAFIDYGKSILVKLTTCDFTLTNGDDNLDYAIENDESTAVAQGVTVLTHAAGNLAASSEELSVAVTGSAKYAGNYTDTITFTVSVE